MKFNLKAGLASVFATLCLFGNANAKNLIEPTDTQQMCILKEVMSKPTSYVEVLKITNACGVVDNIIYGQPGLESDGITAKCRANNIESLARCEVILHQLEARNPGKGFQEIADLVNNMRLLGNTTETSSDYIYTQLKNIDTTPEYKTALAVLTIHETMFNTMNSKNVNDQMIADAFNSIYDITVTFEKETGLKTLDAYNGLVNPAMTAIMNDGDHVYETIETLMSDELYESAMKKAVNSVKVSTSLSPQ